MERTEIKALIKQHTSFTSMLYELLKSLLQSIEVKYHIIEPRTKTIDSLEEKITRKDIRNVEQNVTDISGLRIILYYQDDVDKVIALIKDNFIIDEKNSINKADLYNSNEFGYLSVHYIISLNQKRHTLPEWNKFARLKAEVQIRTVLQHSWASISHELTYKKDYEIPKELQRRLFRLAGLFELVDEQFLKIRDEHDLLKQSIEEISKSNAIETESINLLTLRSIFQKDNTIYKKVASLAIEAGFIGGEREVHDSDLSAIIRVSNLLGLKRISEIEDRLKENLTTFKQFFQEIITNDTDPAVPWRGTLSFYNLLALISHLGEHELKEFFSNRSDWNSEIARNVSKTTLRIKDFREKEFAQRQML